MTASPDAPEDSGAGVEPPTGFGSLRLHDLLLAELQSLGYESPTPIQAEAIPHLVAGRDLLGQAATGTGKTAAFALPILHRLAAQPDGGSPRALVLAPTRELCMQVSAAVHRYGRGLRTRTLPVYGGQPIGRQIRELKAGVDVVVATPGRALDHLRRGTLILDSVATVVLDEADEMLDMGFAEDIDEILAACPQQRQTVLFSATMPRRIQGIAQRHLNDPVRIEIGRELPTADGGSRIRQTAYIVSRQHKVAALGRILDMESPVAALVFCRTRDEVDQLAETLNGRGYRAEALHGGMDQQQRDRVMGRLRSGNAELLVCTDVAARGLDVEHLSHVVNYNVPSAPEDYVHRIGRVGRGGRDGVAITIAEPREHRLLKTISRVTRQDISVDRLPSSADLHNRRLELTRASLYEVALDDDLDDYRVVLDSLTDDFDVVRVALAAVKLAHRQTTPEGGVEEIPQPDRPDRGERRGRDDRERDSRARDRRRDDRSGREGGDRDSRGRGDRRDERGGRDYRGDDGTGRQKGKDGDDRQRSGSGRQERDSRRGAPRAAADEVAQRGERPAKRGGKERRSEPTARIFISAGRAAGLRPQDVVGAIANEAGLSGRDIGAIEIADRFAIVEVPQSSSKDVIAALNRTRLQGNRVKARYDRR